MNLVKKKQYRGLVTSALLLVMIISLSYNGIFNQAEMGFYDLFFRLRGERDPGEEVVIVAIDEKSIAELGLLPWPRDNHAALLNKLSQADIVAFDLLFDLPAEDDINFLSALENSRNVIMASMFSYEQDESGIWYQHINLPTEKLLSGITGTGFINVPVDRGNIIRKITLLDTNYFDAPYPAFGLAIALSYLNLKLSVINTNENFINADMITIPIDSNNQTFINFWGPGGKFPTYSYVDVLNAEVAPQHFTNKIVLVGVTTPVMMDYFENPFTIDNLILTGSLPIAGVEVHASAVNSIINSIYYQKAPWYGDLLLFLVAGLITLTVARLFNPWVAFILILLLAFVISITAYVMWAELLIWFNLFTSLLLVLAGYTIVTIDKFFRSEEESRWIKETFSRYVSNDYVNTLISNPGEITLGGEKKQLTILFADLRAFTSFSDAKEPEKVIQRLNEFFSAMTEIIFMHGGTLDKYLGDGFMAFFGAPIEDEDHAVHGLKASIAMVQKMDELNAEWVARGDQAMQMGIGLNSGYAVVGNIGSENRMDYTVIGQTVNIASRLETLTKPYGVNILIGENTIEMVKTHSLEQGWNLIELGETSVSGVTKSFNIFTLKSSDPL